MICKINIQIINVSSLGGFSSMLEHSTWWSTMEFSFLGGFSFKAQSPSWSLRFPWSEYFFMFAIGLESLLSHSAHILNLSKPTYMTQCPIWGLAPSFNFLHFTCKNITNILISTFYKFSSHFLIKGNGVVLIRFMLNVYKTGV